MARKPVYFDPAVDKLVSMVLALMGELSVLRDRLDTVERLIEKHNLFKQDDIDSFELTEAVNKLRAAKRAEIIAHVLKTVQDDLDVLQTKKD